MNYPSKNESNIYCFHHAEYTYGVAALAHEHFPLLEEINHQIHIAVEAGLIVKWELESKLLKKSNAENSDPYPFSLHHISGCIMALAVGYTLASAAFLCEHFFNSKQKLSVDNNDPALWRVCEKIWVTEERNACSEIMRYFRWKNTKNISNVN